MHSNRPAQPPGCRINASSSVHPPSRGWSVPTRWPDPCAESRRSGRPAANTLRAPRDPVARHVHPQEAGLDGAWHQCLELWGRSEDMFRSVHLLHDIEPRPGILQPLVQAVSIVWKRPALRNTTGVPQADRERVMVRQAAEPAGVCGSGAGSGYRAVISRTAGPSRARRPIVTECADLSNPFEESHISRNLCQETSGRASA